MNTLGGKYLSQTNDFTEEEEGKRKQNHIQNVHNMQRILYIL